MSRSPKVKSSLGTCLFAGIIFSFCDPLLANYRYNFRGIDFYFNTQNGTCSVLQSGQWRYAGTIQQCVNYINANNRQNTTPANNGSNWGRQPSNAQPYYCTTIGQYCSAQQYALEQQYKNQLNNRLNQSIRGFGR